MAGSYSHTGAALILLRQARILKPSELAERDWIPSSLSIISRASNLARSHLSEHWKLARNYAINFSRVSISISLQSIPTVTIFIFMLFSITWTNRTDVLLRLTRTADTLRKIAHIISSETYPIRSARNIISLSLFVPNLIREWPIGSGLWTVRDYRGKQSWNMRLIK